MANGDDLPIDITGAADVTDFGGYGGGLAQGVPAPSSGLGSWLSLFGGGQPAAPQAGTAPGWQQAAAGLGLGLLSGNPFNKWGAALEGYQRGAAADVTRQQMANQYAYQQQQLAQRAQLQREEMKLRRDIANMPPSSIRTVEALVAQGVPR